MRVAVFGATGTIGSALLPALDEHEVVALSRRAQQTREGVQWVTGDVTDAEAVGRVLAGADAAYYLVHSLGSADYAARDRAAAEIVRDEAAKAGVRQLVYLGGLGDESDELSEHLRSRRETGETLASGPVPVTTLRAAMVVGPGSAAFETILALVDRLPGMITPRWVGSKTQPIAIADVVGYLVGVLGREVCRGQAYDIGGPEVMTYREMMERIARLRNRRPVIVEVPFLTPRLSSYWLHLVTPVKAAVARPLVEGLRADTVVRDERIRELVPLELTPFETAARRAIVEREQRGGDPRAAS